MSHPAKTGGDQVTSWIPLTTAFSAPQSCSSLFHLEGGTFVAFDPAYGVDIDSHAICQPAAVTSWWLQAAIFRQTGLQGVHTAWSLLPLICPQGFYTAASRLVSDGASTLAFCCPNEYTRINQGIGTNFGDCVSTVRPGQVLTFASDVGSASSSVSGYATITTSFKDSVVVGAIAVQGYALSDATTSAPRSTISTTSKPTSSNPTSSKFTLSQSTPSQSTPTQSTQSSTRSSILATSKTSQPAVSPAGDFHPQTNGSLSTGAEAGVGIGAALGLIGIAALIVAMLMMRRRRSRKHISETELSIFRSDAKHTDQTQSTPDQASWEQKQGKPDEVRPSHLSRERSELSDDAVFGEMDGRPRVAELEGQMGGWPRR